MLCENQTNNDDIMSYVPELWEMWWIQVIISIIRRVIINKSDHAQYMQGD